MIRRTTIAMVFALAVGTGGVAHGVEPGSGPASSESSAAADALFREAVTLANDAKFEEAARKFAASFAMQPTLGTLLGLSMALEQGGRTASAYARYAELEDRAKAANDAARVATANAAMTRLRARLPKVTLVAQDSLPSDVRWTLDGKALPAAAFGTALPVDPGAHVLEGRRGETVVFARDVIAEEGREARIVVQVQAEQPTKPVEAEVPADPGVDQDGGASTTGLVIGGIGLISMGVGTVFWLKSNGTYNALEEECAAGGCPADKEDRVQSGQRDETIGRVGLIGGGAALLVGVGILAFGSSGDSKMNATPVGRVLVGPGSVSLRGSF